MKKKPSQSIDPTIPYSGSLRSDEAEDNLDLFIDAGLISIGIDHGDAGRHLQVVTVKGVRKAIERLGIAIQEWQSVDRLWIILTPEDDPPFISWGRLKPLGFSPYLELSIQEAGHLAALLIEALWVKEAQDHAKAHSEGN